MHQQIQQLKFLRTQLDLAIAAGDLAVAGIQLQVFNPQYLQLRIDLAPEDGIGARGQFLEGKRLDHVIVGAQVEGFYAVGNAGAGAQNQHGRGQALGPQLLQQVKPVGWTEIQVKNNELIVLARQFGANTLFVGRCMHSITF